MKDLMCARVVCNWILFFNNGHHGVTLEELATHASIPAWRTASTENSGRLKSPWGHKELDTTERTTHGVWPMDGLPTEGVKTLLCFILKPQNLLNNALANVNILRQCHENLQLNYSGKHLGRKTHKKEK